MLPSVKEITNICILHTNLKKISLNVLTHCYSLNPQSNLYLIVSKSGEWHLTAYASFVSFTAVLKNAPKKKSQQDNSVRVITKIELTKIRHALV